MIRLLVLAGVALLVVVSPTGSVSDQSEYYSGDTSGVVTQDLDRGMRVPCCYSLTGGSQPDCCQLMPRFRCYRAGGWVVPDCFKCPIKDFGGPKFQID